MPSGRAAARTRIAVSATPGSWLFLAISGSRSAFFSVVLVARWAFDVTDQSVIGPLLGAHALPSSLGTTPGQGEAKCAAIHTFMTLVGRTGSHVMRRDLLPPASTVQVQGLGHDCSPCPTQQTLHAGCAGSAGGGGIPGGGGMRGGGGTPSGTGAS